MKSKGSKNSYKPVRIRANGEGVKMKSKKSSAIEPKNGDQYITINKGLSGEYKVKVLKRQPRDWKPIKGARTAPPGYKWVSNGKSVLSGQYKTALVKNKEYQAAFPTLVEPVKVMGKAVSKQSVPPKKRNEVVTQAVLNKGVQNFVKVKEQLKSGEVRNLAFKKPMKFYHEHTVDEAIKILKLEAKNR